MQKQKLERGVYSVLLLQGSNWALLDEKFWVLIRRTSVMYLNEYLKYCLFMKK